MAFEYNNADKFAGAAHAAGQGIGAAWQQARHETQQNMPIPQELANYYQRILKGEDPVLVGQQAKQDPVVQQFLKTQLGGGQSAIPPQTQLSQVGPGAGPGSPQLYKPGGVNPMHGPKGPMPSLGLGAGGGPGAISGSNPVTGAAMGPIAPDYSRPGTQYGSPPLDPWAQQAGRSLGDIQSASHGAAKQAVGGQFPQLASPGAYPGGGDGGAGFMNQMRNQGGMPMQAPQVDPTVAGAGIPREQPGGGRFVERMNFPPPQFQGGDTIARKDAPMWAAAAEQALTQRTRESVARESQQGRMQLEEMKLTMQGAIAAMKQRGMDDATIVKLMLGTAGEEGKQQRFVEAEKGKTERAGIHADAAKAAAGIRAAVPKSDPRYGVLNNIMTSIKGLTSVTSWEAQPELRSQVDQQIRMYDELAGQLGVPLYTKPAGGSAKPAPAGKPAAKAPAAKKPEQANAGGKTPPRADGKILVKRNGQDGYISPQNFNPQTDVKL